MIDIKIQGIEQNRSALEKLKTKKLLRSIDREFEDSADLLVQSVKEEAPVQTGYLRDSVRSSVARKHFKEIKLVDVNAPYATKVQQRNPFVSRGIAKVERRVPSLLRKGLRRIIRRIGFGL